MGLHIAVVEDDEPYRSTIEEILGTSSEVAAVTGFGAAEPFLEAHRSKPFDLVLLDITMPGMSGLDALDQLAGSDKTPIIMLSSSTSQDDVDRAYDRGARGYLVKPLTLDELEDLLEDLVNMWSRMARPSADA